MSRRLPTAALLAALVLPPLAGCGPSAATSGRGGPSTSLSSPAGKPADSGKDTAKTTKPHHEPG